MPRITIRGVIEGLCWSALLALGTMSGAGSAAAQNATETPPPPRSEKPLPPKVSSISIQSDLAASELSRVDQAISQLSEELATLSEGKAAFARVAPTLASLEQLRPKARTACGGTEEQKGDFLRQLETVSRPLRDWSSGQPRIFPWESPTISTEELCTVGAEALLDTYVNALAPPQSDARIAELERQIDTLRVKRVELIKGISEGVAAANVTGWIPVLMLIIFGVGALVLAGVKLFGDEIQLELISSGQIVQFVTILILLGVILALGLAERLKAETLGTLLGGLAGYVLSQGVGRQERQRVIETIKAVTNTPPP